MKKILSLGLAVTMAMAALPTAYAADTQDYTLGSTVSVIGNAASEYEIKVPARLEAGGAAGNVVATGTWRSSETLIVTAADEVEVTEETTGAKTMVPVVFDGINAKGNDLAAMSISKAVSVEKGDILFGTWTGIVEYDVHMKTKMAAGLYSNGAIAAHANGEDVSDQMLYGWNELIARGDITIQDGVVTKSKNMNGELVIAEGITSIGSAAFCSCGKEEMNLTNVIIPEGVTALGSMSFCNSSLSSITIPKTVTTIGESCFRNAPSTMTVNYTGTQEEFALIDVSDIYNSPFEKATKNYNYGID